MGRFREGKLLSNVLIIFLRGAVLNFKFFDRVLSLIAIGTIADGIDRVLSLIATLPLANGDQLVSKTTQSGVLCKRGNH